MKKIVLYLLLCIVSVSLSAQPNAIYISGHVTDSTSGNPLPNYMVHIDIDSAGGFFCHHIVHTMPDGFYADHIFFNPAAIPSGILTVSVWDCQMHPHAVTFDFGPGNLTFTNDFAICIGPPPPPPCHAEFAWQPDTIPGTLTIHFINLSTPMNATWNWDFGDSTFSTDQDPVHTYAHNGKYHIALTMNQANPACQDIERKELHIGPPPPPPCSNWITFRPHWLKISFEGQTPMNFPADYSWNFGDSTTGSGKHIDHTYAAPGCYKVTLTTVRQDSSQCTWTSFMQVRVFDSIPMHPINGQVFAGNDPLNFGLVMLFGLDTTSIHPPFFTVDFVHPGGHYMLPCVPDGDYIIWALPFDSLGGYLPTFYGDVISWHDATVIHLGQPQNPYNIHLVHAKDAPIGPGKITGHISLLKSGEIDQAVMLITDEQENTIGFRRVDVSGAFNFDGMAYGTYYLKPELPNTTGIPVKVMLSAENPVVDVNVTLSGTGAQGISQSPAIASFSVYPNPVKDILNLNLEMISPVTGTAEIFAINGTLAGQLSFSLKRGENQLRLNFNNLTNGTYLLRIYSPDGINITQKIIK